jgi:uncharacterized protein (TIGR00251 family)
MAQLHVKVVPGSSRDRIAGRLGDALKLQVSAAPERGKANEAVIDLIAATLGLPRNAVQIVRGQSQPRKLLQINGIEQSELDRRLSAFQ